MVSFFEKSLIFVLVCLCSFISLTDAAEPSADEIAKMNAAAPSKASVSPEKPRKLLVFNRNDGFFHSAIPYGAKALEIIGQKSGAFEAVISDDYNVFTPDKLAEFDAIFFNNTTGLKFPDQNHRKAIMDFVRNGGGFGGLHGATDNFPEWPEAIKLIGGRFDGHPWGGGNTKWAFKLTDPASPINKSFGGKGFKLADEIYVYNTFQQDDLHVLLELDFSDGTTGNLGQDRASAPVSWIRNFGKGRVFYCSLGHNHDVFWNAAVLGHILDGLQFALGDLDADATPNYTQVGQFKGWLDSFSSYEYGGGLGLFDRIAAFVNSQNGSADGLAKAEAAMADFLASDATLASKYFISRQLSEIATDNSVDTVGEMLKNNDTFDMALFVLVRCSGKKADNYLVSTLMTFSPDQQIAIINTLGARGNEDVVGALLKMTRTANAEITAAAFQAMGRIGTINAGQFIAKAISAKSDTKSKLVIYDAYLRCAEGLAASGKVSEAVKIYKSMFKNGLPLDVRIAAMTGIVMNDPKSGGRLLLDVLKSGDEELLPYAIALVSKLEGANDIKAIAGMLDTFSVSDQVQLLSAFAKCKNPEASSVAIMKAVDSKESDVRIAAIKAIAVAGDESAVMPLALKAANTGGDEQRAARESLYQLSGESVDKKIISSASTNEGEVKVELIRAIGERRSGSAVASLLEMSQEKDAKIKREVFASLKAVGGIDDLDEMVDLLLGLKDNSQSSQLEDAITAVANKDMSAKSRADAVLSAMKKAKNVDTRCSLLRICGKIGDDKALSVLRDSLDDSNKNISDAAFRSLADWPGPAPMDDMYSIASNSKDQMQRILALRAYIRMVGIPANRVSSETVKLLKKAMDIADRPEEKKLVLSALPKFVCDDAIKLAQSCVNDAQLKGEAEITINRINAVLNNKKIVVSASCRSDQAGQAIDGNMSSRWDTGRGMQAGDWFMIDLGFEDSIKKIVLDTTGSNGDYPRGYEVYSSYDGGSWGMPIVTSETGKTVIEIEFEKPLRTRFVKIVQLGREGNFWSIHELKVEYNR